LLVLRRGCKNKINKMKTISNIYKSHQDAVEAMDNFNKKFGDAIVKKYVIKKLNKVWVLKIIFKEIGL